MSVVIETTIGDFTVDLLLKERPRTCFNFLKLCRIKFYNNNLFHKIQRDFVVQTGDPAFDRVNHEDHIVSGGTSIFTFINGKHQLFAKEDTKLKHEQFGTLSMVDNGEGMHGSQFFITLGDNLDSLDATHSVFGYVVEGMHVLHAFNAEICDHSHRPFRDIRITHTVVLDDPFDDPPELSELIGRESPEPWPEVFSSDRIGVEEAIDETEGKTLEQVAEELEDKEAKARATILEMIGDLPDADMAPPENVLFICKLNQVTRDDDLEVIFSRFGQIKSCEIIRDSRTGESLQYGFIEFANKQDCEKAYFKMDNVLIDDRRIHVDFSQSVAQYKWRGKGRGVIVKDDKNKESDVKKREKYHPKESESRRRSQEKEHRKRSRSRSRDRNRSREHKKSRDHRDDRDRRYRNERSRSRERDRRRSGDHKHRHSRR